MRIFQMQRFSAIALLVFLTIHMVVVHYPPFHIDFSRIVERMAQELARDLEALPPDDQRRVIDLMKRLRGDRGAEEADRVSLGADS